MVNWEKIRKQFPAVENAIYLNPASASPIFKEAAEVGKQFYDEVLMHGDSKWEEWLSKTEIVREKIANLINADKSEVAFISNTSLGMNIIAQMLKGKGEVITMDDEFPASTLPWINQEFKLNFVKPENRIYSINSIEKQVNEKTKILVTSHIQSFTGFKQDLIELGKYCKSKNLIYVVNATQSVGVVPIDVKKANIDFLVFSSVKWLMTGESIGALYINKKWLNKVKWPMVGWLSVRNTEFDNKNLNLKKDVSVLELGGQPFHSIFVLGKAIDLINSIGIKNIEERVSELTDYLIERLKKLKLEVVSCLDKKYRSSIIAVRVKNPKETARTLLQKNVIVSERRGGLRISLHIYNNKGDIDRLISELKIIIKPKRIKL